MDFFRMPDFAASLGESIKGAGVSRYPEREPDNTKRHGRVYFLWRAINSGGKKDDVADSAAVMHHWAIVVEFENGEWVQIEGLKEGGWLAPGYCRSSSRPSGNIIDIYNVPGNGVDEDKKGLYMLIVPQWMKSLSFEPVRQIEASPRDLHELAGSIPVRPYCLGVNDRQTWFLDAMRKLQFFNVGLKTLAECAEDALRSPTKLVTTTGVKAASTVTNTAMEAVTTVRRVFSMDENPPAALADGVGRTTNHVLNGVSETACGFVDGVASFTVNAIGLATGGGCATKGSLEANADCLDREVRSGKKSKSKAAVQAVGIGVGRIVNGAANTTTNVIEGTTETATGLVSGLAGTIAAPFKAVEEIATAAAKKDVHPALAIAAAPGLIVVRTGQGVGKTVVNVGRGIGKTASGAFKGIASIFQ